MGRFRLRYGMRALLVVMTICCVVVAWQVNSYRARKQLISDIRSAGGTFGVRIDGPDFLRKWIGDDEYFYEPLRISFGPGNALPLAPADRLNAVLAACTSLGELEVLDLRGSKIDDESLALVVAMPTVRVLRISNTKVTDAGLEHLHQMTGLENIWIGGTQLSDEAVARLHQSLPHCVIDHGM